MATFFGVLLLLVVAGTIAYTGDLIGRRLGKKRLTIFGLRPRHTAVLLTIISGGLIALLTFVAALISVPGFRRLVTEGEKLARQNLQLQSQIAMQQQRSDRLIGENEGLVSSNDLLNKENKALATTNRRIAGENEGLFRKNSSLTAGNRDLARVNQRLQASSAKLSSENRALTSRNLNLAAESSRLQGRNQRLAREVTSLEGERGRLTTQVEDLTAKKYLFARGDELGREAFPTAPPIPQLQRRILYLLEQAESRLRQRGEELGASPAGLRLEGLPDARSADAWAAVQARSISDRYPSQGILLRIVAQENSVIGRPVPVRLESSDNELIFAEGKEIAARSINSQGTDGLIFEELMVLLNRAGAAAREAGVVPDRTGVGELYYGLLLDTLKEIRGSDGVTMVTAHVKNDTRRSGPLNLRLQVRTGGAARTATSR